MAITLGILFLVALFLAWKFNQILGTKTGFTPELSSGEPSSAEGSESGDNFAGSLDADVPAPFDDSLIANGADADTVKEGLSEVTNAIDSFEPKSFSQDAKAAFDFIMTAFADGDRDTLSSLVSKEIYDAFDSAIQAREDAGQELRFSILTEPKVSFTGAEVDRGIAYVSVQIETEQTSATLDAEGNNVSGDLAGAQKVVNRWMFSKSASSNDPTWTLVSTAA